jgi:hypothetical protein
LLQIRGRSARDAPDEKRETLRQVPGDWRSVTTHNGGFNTEGKKFNVEI